MRTTYKPSGCVRQPQFLLFLAAAVTASALVAATYFVMLYAGFYVLLAGVIGPVTVLALVAYMGVHWSHCRNPGLAAAVGFAMGMVGFLGYFHVDQAVRHGVPLHRIDRIPTYILYRLETDSWQSVGKAQILQPMPAVANKLPAPRLVALPPLWNIVDVLLQMLLLASVPALVTYISASQPYSEATQQWCQQSSLDLARSSGDALAAAISDDSIVAWAESGPRKSFGDEPGTRVCLWYVPRRPTIEVDGTCFLSLNDGPLYRLSAAETAAFVGLLPGIQEIAGPIIERLVTEALVLDDKTSARIWPVSHSDAGQGRNLLSRLIHNIVIVGLACGPLAALFIGALVLGSVGINRQVPWLQLVSAVLFGLGLLLLHYVFGGEPTWYVNRANHLEAWLFRRAVARRLDAIVPADCMTAVYSHMKPRSCWEGAFSLPSKINPGLLELDHDDQIIRFEGDYYRWLIPTSAVIDCTLEIPPDLPEQSSLWLAVLQVQLGRGPVEIPLLPLHGIEGRNPWERAVALLARVESLCGRTFSHSSSSHKGFTAATR